MIMQAVVQDGDGGADRRQVRTLTVPQPGVREVLIRVEAAGVDRGVCIATSG